MIRLETTDLCSSSNPADDATLTFGAGHQKAEGHCASGPLDGSGDGGLLLLVNVSLRLLSTRLSTITIPTGDRLMLLHVFPTAIETKIECLSWNWLALCFSKAMLQSAELGPGAAA